MKTITIDVTRDDINKGAKKDCTMCPVARAVSRAFGTEDVYVGPLFLHAGDEYDDLYPSIVKEFIHAFDNNQPVSPFTFTLQLPKNQ